MLSIPWPASGPRSHDLSPDEASALQAHVEGCDECRAELSDFVDQKAATDLIRERLQYDDALDDYWKGVHNRLERGIGIGLLIVGFGVMAGFGLFAALSDPSVPLWLRIGIGASAMSSFVADSANEAIVAGSQGRLRLLSPFHHSGTVLVERRGEVIERHDTSYKGEGFAYEVAEMERCDGSCRTPVRAAHACAHAGTPWERRDDVRTLMLSHAPPGVAEQLRCAASTRAA